MNESFTVTILAFVISLIFGLIIGCGDDEEIGCPEIYGIYQTGQETAMNGSYKGSNTTYSTHYLSLQDGSVITHKLSGSGMSFCVYCECGYIGFYSFNGTEFKAVLNTSAPGAPVPCGPYGVVTDKIVGTVDDNTITGMWTDMIGTEAEEEKPITLEKYTNEVIHYCP